MPKPVSADSSQRQAMRRDLVAGLLAGLPVDASIAVGWRSPLESGDVADESCDESLRARAFALLDETALPVAAPLLIAARWELPSGCRGAAAVALSAPVPPDVRMSWCGMARALVASHVEAERAYGRAESLEKSERLQQALYEIADLAGSGAELADMLRMVHHVIGGLMYAENFYIVLYDAPRETCRFVYFADERDDWDADPEREITAAEIPNSLTLALLRNGEAVRGPSAHVREQLGVPRDDSHGPDSEDWLGVPMLRDGRVCGAIVVQSYDRASVYGEEERALLAFVAQHILTALDRRHERGELEHRVLERTQELRQVNRDLQAQIGERERAEQLQSALFRIAELSMTAPSLESFYREVHLIVGELLYARNFYVAMISDDGERLEFPYSIDERDTVRESRPLGFGMTEFVLTHKHPVLADLAEINRLTRDGQVLGQGALAYCWLGVPLYREEQAAGVIAVQSYSPDVVFNLRDQELLTFVAHHIGIGMARKLAQDKLFAVIFLDLDRFKLINDSAGHATGDELLIEAGRRIVATVRGGDVVSRLGGDEYAVLVHDLDSLHFVEELAGRILEALGRPWWVAGREVFPSASIGIALWHPRYRSGAELLRDADAAMYRAKAAGRGRWATFDEAMREEAMRILDLEADLRRAINADGFVAFYQPIVNMTDRSVVGHEALLRWSHSSSGLLTPAAFIGVGENASLIEEVDWLVYAQVADRLAHTTGGYISVNVSPRHFRDAAFADRLLRLLEKAKADPHRLRIEITEGALLDEAPRVLNMLGTLRSHGVLAQLDDFGTGFSALSYLHRFPIECLKIDQSFIAGLSSETRNESEAVIRAIQALAGSLGIHTVAEGIENLQQQKLVRELGCTLGQGYLYGRPLPELVTSIDVVRGLAS